MAGPYKWILARQHRAHACALNNKYLLSNHQCQPQGWVLEPRCDQPEGNALLGPKGIRALGSAGGSGTHDRLDVLANGPRALAPRSHAVGKITPLFCILLARTRKHCLANRSPCVDKGKNTGNQTIPQNLHPWPLLWRSGYQPLGYSS